MNADIRAKAITLVTRTVLNLRKEQTRYEHHINRLDAELTKRLIDARMKAQESLLVWEEILRLTKQGAERDAD